MMECEKYHLGKKTFTKKNIEPILGNKKTSEKFLEKLMRMTKLKTFDLFKINLMMATKKNIAGKMFFLSP